MLTIGSLVTVPARDRLDPFVPATALALGAWPGGSEAYGVEIDPTLADTAAREQTYCD